MKNNVRFLLVGGLCSFVIFSLTGRASAANLVHPMNLRIQVSGSPTSPDCGTLPSGKALICYSPQMVRAAYNYAVTFEAVTLDGAGQTIAIVDAYGSPTILPTTSPNYGTSDLAKFDDELGLPDPPSLTIACPTAGCPVFNPSDTKHDEVGWAMETSLDVEWAHAAAPAANIVLVVAASSAWPDINAAVQSAINFPGVSVISQSFGQAEYQIAPGSSEVTKAHANYELAQSNRITVLASTGDSGATNGSKLPNATFPASDPLVTAVGGSEGLPYPAGLYASGGYGGEQVWNENDRKDGIIGATGGAPSDLFPAPTFQKGPALAFRTIPDVSYNAAQNGGVLVYVSALGGSTVGFYVMGGTGASAPQWAGIVAMTNQMRELMGNSQPLGYINPAIYMLAQGASAANDFHDITVGNNQLRGTHTGFPATRGYDLATGWGTPNVANLVPDLANAVE